MLGDELIRNQGAVESTQGPKGKPNRDDKAAAPECFQELTEVNFIIDLNFLIDGKCTFQRVRSQISNDISSMPNPRQNGTLLRMCFYLTFELKYCVHRILISKNAV